MFTVHDMTTRELLNARNRTRNYYLDDDERVFVGSRFAPGGQQINVWATRDEIISALNGREHVSSKKEAQVIRQLKAKTKQSKEWLRAHPKYGQEIADACTPDRKVVDAKTYQQLTKLYGVVTPDLFKIGE